MAYCRFCPSADLQGVPVLLHRADQQICFRRQDVLHRERRCDSADLIANRRAALRICSRHRDVARLFRPTLAVP